VESKNNHKINAVISILEQYPVSKKIVAFFLEHKFAMDTARGIAEWWIQADLEETQEALQHLVDCGVVIVRTYATINLYSFTTDAQLQAKLRTYFQSQEEG
jgi:hypothetical protein